MIDEVLETLPDLKIFPATPERFMEEPSYTEKYLTQNF